MKHKKITITSLVMMIFALLLLTGCTGKESKASKAVKTYEIVSEQTIQIEKDYLNEDGYIKSDDVDVLLSEVYACAETLYADGIITDYAYKTGDTCVYMKIDDWLGFLYMPPLEAALSGGSDGKVEIYTVQPYSTEFTAYRLAFASGVFFNKTPDITAELLHKTFSKECEYKTNYDDDEISIEIFLNFPKQSVVMWEGHGGYNDKVGSFLGLGNQKLDEQTLDVYDIFVGADALLVAQNGQYCVTSVFFEKIVPENAYEGCLFYLNTCSSFTDERLARSIRDKGARCVIGNTTKTWIPYSTTMMYRFFEGFTKQNDSGNFYTVSEALNYAKEKEGEIDPLYGSSVEAVYRDDFAFPDMLSEIHESGDEYIENTDILNNEQLKYVCEQLGIPKELSVEISQENPVYWEAGECWTIYVTVYDDGKMVAAANVNSETAELIKDIWQYTPAQNTSETVVGISETWLQEDVNDPLMFAFQKDGTVLYMPTVSRGTEYMTKYMIENDILTIQLVELGATGVVPVSYKLTYDDSNGNSRVRLELIEPEKDVDISRLYGWESIIPGWYSRED